MSNIRKPAGQHHISFDLVAQAESGNLIDRRSYDARGNIFSALLRADMLMTSLSAKAVHMELMDRGSPRPARRSA